MFPPLLLYLHVQTPTHRGPAIWLPLFLIWLLLLPLVVLVLLFTAIADTLLFLTGQRYHHYTLFLLGCLGLLAAARGTTVHIHADDHDIDVCFV